MYKVYAEPPEIVDILQLEKKDFVRRFNVGWPFRSDYFPRLIYYKKDAVKLAECVKHCYGGIDVRIELVKKGKS